MSGQDWPECISAAVVLDPDGPNVDADGNRFRLDPETVVWSNTIDYAGLCGCGDPEVIEQALMAYMRCLNHESWDDRPPLEVQHSLCGGVVAWYFCAYIADALGWTEHGTSIHGAWITDAGKRALGVLVE